MVPATSAIDETLARIASALHVPVLVLALLALLACALEAGRFAAELLARRRDGRGALTALGRQMVFEPVRAASLSPRAPSAASAAALLAIARAGDERTQVEDALADFELAVQRRLDVTRILVRAGPALGLMGTLIPLAPGLAALGHGDLQTLAGDLRTAFAATTVGLLVGTVAFALTLLRTRLYGEDLAELERVVQPMPSGPSAPSSDGRAAASATAAPGERA
jgi:biopolymer transport protein ExbB/TolQ